VTADDRRASVDVISWDVGPMVLIRRAKSAFQVAFSGEAEGSLMKEFEAYEINIM
jgi:hypothetical protein